MTVQEKLRAGGSFLLERHDASVLLFPEAFDEELKMMEKSAKQFVEREIKSVMEELEALSYELSRKKLRQAGELGLLAVEIPEAYGGLGESKAASMLVGEALATSGSFSVTFNAHSGIGTLPLVYFGTPEQCARYLPKLATGELVGAYCLTEPGSGSDALAAKTRALLSDDGKHYRLTGTKMWISNAGFADLFTVFAQVDGDKFTAFLVERDTPGLSVGAEEKKMGIKGSSTCQVILEDALVPVENVLGEVGKGHVIAFQILNLGRLKLAASAVGGCKEMLRLASRYAGEREQFGRKIGEFGLIQEKLGRMAAYTYALESAVYRVTGELDRALEGRASQLEQLEAIGEYVIEYSFLKVAGSEILDEVIDETLQIYGGLGFSAEYPIEAAYRNSRINRIFEGTNEINRLLTAEQLLKRALKGKLPLMEAFQRAMGEEAAQGDDAMAAVENLKRATLLVAGTAAMALQQQLEHEQEVLARLADMVMGIYLAESAQLRAERLTGEKRALAEAMASVVTFEEVAKARAGVLEVLQRLPGDQGAALAKVQAYLPSPKADLIGLRREVAKATLDAGRYPLAG
jgi:alkylation response protein AidB-like acyl-CoA dehydrogenase